MGQPFTAWLRVSRLREVGIEGHPADPEALGDLGDRDVAGGEQSTPHLQISLGQRLAPAALAPAGDARP